MADIINLLCGFGNTLKTKFIDKGNGTFAPLVEAYPPSKLMTDGDGPSARLRVDSGSTGFFAGREFRSFSQFNLAGSESISFKASLPIDTILQGLGINLMDGYVKLEAFMGVTSPTGFTTALPSFGANRMATRPQPYYVAQNALFEGGSFTGGTLIDLVLVKTNNNSNQASTQDAAVAGERGLAAGDYYLRLTNLSSTGSATGMLMARWEERP